LTWLAEAAHVERRADAFSGSAVTARSGVLQ
jgi:hypothetical protein